MYRVYGPSNSTESHIGSEYHMDTPSYYNEDHKQSTIMNKQHRHPISISNVSVQLRSIRNGEIKCEIDNTQFSQHLYRKELCWGSHFSQSCEIKALRGGAQIELQLKGD